MTSKTKSQLEMELKAAQARIAQFERDLKTKPRSPSLEEDLRQSESRYRLISENAADVIWVLDPLAGKFTYVSPSVMKLRGYTPDEVMAQPVNAALTPESLKLVNQSISESLPPFIAAGSGTMSFINKVDQPHKDGHIVHTEVTTTYLFNECGAVEIVGVSRDISQRKQAENALRESEERFRTIFETMLEGVQIIGFDWRYQYLNSAAEKHSRRPNFELLGNVYMEMWPGAENTTVFSVIKRCMEERIPCQMENEFIFPDGERRWFDLGIQPVPEGVYIHSIDITERKRAEQELQENKRVLQLFVSYAPAAIAMFDQDMRYIATSQRYIADYRIPQGDIIGQSHYEIFPEIHERWKEIHRRCLAGAVESADADPFPRADGTLDWVHWEIHPWYKAENSIGGIILFSELVTERKRSEETLTQLAERLNLATRSAYMGIWDWNIQKNELVWDDQMYALYGLKPAEFGGAYEAWLNGIHPDDRGPGNEISTAAVRGERVYDTEFRVLWRDGSVHWLKANGEVIRDAAGMPLRMVGVNYDITERKYMENALRESEERFSKAFHTNPVSQSIMTREGRRIIEVNDSFCRLFEYSREEMIGATPSKIVLWQDPADRAAALEELQATGRVLPRETNFQTGTGRTGTVIVAIEPILWKEGVDCLLSSIIDISERKRAEALISAQRDLAHAFSRLDTVQSGYSLCLEKILNFPGMDSGGLYLYDAEFRKLELVHHQGLGDDFIRAVSNYPIDAPNVQVLLASGEAIYFSAADPFIQNTASESEGLRAMAVIPIHYQGRVIGCFNLASHTLEHIPDYTQHAIETLAVEVGNLIVYLRANEDLSTSEKKYRDLSATLEERVREQTAEVHDLYDNAPAGYHSLDAQGRIVAINQTELNWLGYTRAEVFGHGFYEFITEKSKKVFQEYFPQFLQRGFLNDLELEVVRKDGSIFPILVNATAIHDEQGGYLMSRSTIFDNTERRKAEEALRESYDQITITNIALENALRVKDEFLASMSHELRTPLTGILGFSEVMRLGTYGDLNPRQLKALKTIEDSGQHLLALINDVLDLSKIEAGKLEIRTAPCPLADICSASLELTKGMAHQKKQQVTFSAPASGSITLDVDSRRIKQVIVNLLSNAIKFTPVNGELGLEVKPDPENHQIRLVVWDKGIGIKPEDLQKLFLPFTQIDSGLDREYSGTGLGLSLVRRLVELHGGSVTVASSFGLGSRFTVALPWDPQTTPVAIPGSAGKLQPQIHPVVVAGPSQLILIAEDNEILLDMLADFLAAQNYRVARRHDGSELLAGIADVRPNLILMDIQMPGVNGLEVLRQIRAHADPAIASIPIIAVTALAMPGDRERCLAAGANEYISKPVALKSLLDEIRNQIPKSFGSTAGPTSG